MSLILNILWFFLGGGALIFVEYLLGGLLLCLTVVGIPFGVQTMKLSILGLAPFGVEIVETPTSAAGGALRFVLNVVWILVAGVWIAISHLVLAVPLALTIIGIPFAVQHLKFAQLALTPFGRTIKSRP